jgi:hypothetical protein
MGFRFDEKSQLWPKTAAAVLAYKRRRNIVNTAYQTTADDIVGVIDDLRARSRNARARKPAARVRRPEAAVAADSAPALGRPDIKHVSA